MAHIKELSKISKDLLEEDAKIHCGPLRHPKVTTNDAKPVLAHAPPAPEIPLDHPVQVNCPKIKEFVEMRRKLGGNAQAEQLIKELAGAAQINRGPEGLWNSSRIHLDMLLDKDSTIDFGDYLNEGYNNFS